ncbi:MAG: ribonuclease HII, partial [Burkholderiales bacterium]|nr:ribonuclease HII [Opitutaceae bacterium]
YNRIMKVAHVGVGIADLDRIDRDNILGATLWAMAQAVAALGVEPKLVLVDGNKAPRLAMAARTIVKGDAKCLSIAAASIIAKVTRDRMMLDLDTRYPGYGFAQHKGYGTEEHRDAVLRIGRCPEHRETFLRKLMASRIDPGQLGLLGEAADAVDATDADVSLGVANED